MKSVAEPTRSSISISLTTTELESAPSFDALSYTWGNSSTPFSESQNPAEVMNDVRRHPVDVDGRSLLTTANLMDALQTLSSSSVQVDAERSRYLWIDSISINQDDLAERADQVTLMGSIYEAAKNVLVWSGREDEFTKDALSAIKILSMIPRQQHSEVKLTDWYDQSHVLAKFGIFDDITPDMWCGLGAFLNRPLFSRVWIVQEVALAKNPILICGKYALPWSMLSTVVAFLTTTGWHDQISADVMKTHDLVLQNPGRYRKFLASHANVGMAAVYLQSTRSGIATFGHKALFRHLIHVHRCCKATDPRDMIYALLGIAWQERPPFLTHAAAFVPDYTISVQDLYTKVARTMLQSYKDLRFLSHVQDPSHTAIQRLPSWVPDYSVDLRPPPLSIRHATWKAAGDLSWVDEPDSVNAGHLPVAGILLERIADVVAATPDPHEFRESPNTDAYWLQAFRLAQKIKPGFPTQSRFDTFWRTILADTYDGQHPAPASFAHTFFDYLVRGLARCYVSEEVRRKNMILGLILRFLPKRWKKYSLALQGILNCEPTMSPFRSEDLHKQFWAAVDRQVTSGPDPNHRLLFGKFEQEMRYTLNVRRLFCTETGFFGCGPQSLERDDQVWILGGAATPMVLRKLPTGGYRLIGEAYVHGVMHGEAVTSTTQDQLQRLILE